MPVKVLEKRMESDRDLVSNDWDVVNEKVEESKIFRFSYKRLLGVSLTCFITRHMHTSNEKILEAVLREPAVQEFLTHNPSMAPKFIDNVKTSISARRAEQGTFVRRLK